VDRAGAPHQEPTRLGPAHPAGRTSPAADALARRHLVDRLRAVSAPRPADTGRRGCGLGQDHAGRGVDPSRAGPGGLVSVDETDSDPARFWGAVTGTAGPRTTPKMSLATTDNLICASSSSFWRASGSR